MRNLILFLFLVRSGLCVDNRLYNHGACFVEVTQNDSTMYYLTWSSAHNSGWEHDIYHRLLYFNTDGTLYDVMPTKRYIGTGSDEAQEPVHCTKAKGSNVILSVWEDGSGSEAPNVRGQLHKSDGETLKENWIIAGGVGSQHSANTAHLEDSYVVLYADEAAPATKGAVVKAKVIDDSSGEEKQTIVFSPYDEDHWWPVSISNKAHTRTLVAWGNDGYAVMGAVLHKNADSVKVAAAPRDFLVNTQQYYYQLEWLDSFNQFLIVARHGAYENLTDSSQICLVDTLGNISKKSLIAGGIERESKMAVRFHAVDSTYSILYPTGKSSLVHLTIQKDGSLYSVVDSIVPTQNSMDWVSTGIWGECVSAVDGNNKINDSTKLLFIQNDTASNDILLQQISFDDAFWGKDISLISAQENKKLMVQLYAQKGVLYVPPYFKGKDYTIYSIHGKVLQKGILAQILQLPESLSDQVILVQINSERVSDHCFKVLVR